ncbi:MAG: OmpH family outer membrane protein [Deltaproteobacteria bacterium]|nr:OmpH family outer membrane protein [Deltaproteobacteria bacterium]
MQGSVSIHLLISAALAGGVLAAPKSASAQKKDDVLIGYVSIQRAILETEEGKRAKDSLKATFDEKQKKLNAKEGELMKMKDALEKEAAKKDDAETRKKVMDFQNKLLELRQTFMKEQQELTEAEQKQLAGITAKMKKIIEEMGKEGGYSMILEVADSRLLYAKPHLDLTNELIRKYNSRHK